MEDLDFELLSRIYDSPSHEIRIDKLINEYFSDCKLEAQKVMYRMMEEPGALIKKVGTIYFGLTVPLGIETYKAEKERRRLQALEDAKKDAEKKEQEEKQNRNRKIQYRHDFRVAAFSSILGAVVGALLTLLIQLILGII